MVYHSTWSRTWKKEIAALLSVVVSRKRFELRKKKKKIREQEERTRNREKLWERENFNQVSSIAKSIWILVIINVISENKKCITNSA